MVVGYYLFDDVCCGLEKGRLVWGKLSSMGLSTLATDPPGQLDVLGHDGDPLGVDGAQVGVLKETNQVGLAGLLESHDSRALEPQVSLEVLGNLPDQALEGQLADEELSGLLVPPDLTEGHCARPVPVGLLDTPGGGGTLPSGLGGQLLPGGLASSGLPSGLLGASHCAGSVVLMLLGRVGEFLYQSFQIWPPGGSAAPGRKGKGEGGGRGAGTVEKTRQTISQ